MSDIIRCYLDTEKPLYQQLQDHFTQHYQGKQIDIRFEQNLIIDSSRLSTFLITLPNVKRGEETDYMRRIFLSALPILIPSVIYLEHITSPDRPISESSLEQMREWLRMSQYGRLFKRQLLYYDTLHIGADVPLITGNMRQE